MELRELEITKKILYLLLKVIKFSLMLFELGFTNF